MSAFQTLLLPNLRTLVEWSGRDCFLRLTVRPGVYLMRDADLETVIGFTQTKARRTWPFTVPVTTADDQSVWGGSILPFMDEDWKPS
jgi:hypothetical protein